MISPGRPSININDIKEITTELDIAYHYLNLSKIPCKINSPLRPDTNPSFAVYSPGNNEVNYIDFSNGERGNIFTLLRKLWNVSIEEVCARIYKDLKKNCINSDNKVTVKKNFNRKVANSSVSLECKTREWQNHDIEYWKSFGISLQWLKYANVYPVSHKIIIKDNIKYVFGADKYAYAYAEFKEGKVSLKIYQPYNKNGFKWANKHDKSVISLWTKVPKEGNILCICSSLKDALCLWANTGIPAIAIQGEGYSMSETAIKELKNRFKKVFILLDNDEAGLRDAEILASKTGFTNIVLPKINNTKDISDLYKSLDNKNQFKQIIYKLFKIN